LQGSGEGVNGSAKIPGQAPRTPQFGQCVSFAVAVAGGVMDLQGSGEGIDGPGQVPAHAPYDPQVGQGTGVGGGAAVAFGGVDGGLVQDQGTSVGAVGAQDLGESRGQGEGVFMQVVGVGVGVGMFEVVAFGA
jgi:hypothetical protein